MKDESPWRSERRRPLVWFVEKIDTKPTSKSVVVGLPAREHNHPNPGTRSIEVQDDDSSQDLYRLDLIAA